MALGGEWRAPACRWSHGPREHGLTHFFSPNSSNKQLKELWGRELPVYVSLLKKQLYESRIEGLKIQEYTDSLKYVLVSLLAYVPLLTTTTKQLFFFIKEERGKERR